MARCAVAPTREEGVAPHSRRKCALRSRIPVNTTGRRFLYVSANARGGELGDAHAIDRARAVQRALVSEPSEVCREVRVARTRSIAVAGATARGVRDPDEHERDECRGQRRTRSSHRQCKWRLREREGVTVDLPARFASRKKNTCPTRQIVAPKSHTRGRVARAAKLPPVCPYRPP